MSIYSTRKSRKQNSGPSGAKRGKLLKFSTFLSQLKGELFGEKTNFRKESLTLPKNRKGGPFGLARYGILRGKTGKTFLLQFARSNGAIECNNNL